MKSSINSTTVSAALKSSSQNTEVVITPHTPSVRHLLEEIWHNRSLLVTFVRRDFMVAYKQTILGPLWALFQPAVTILIYTFVFARLAKLSTGNSPAPLFYLSGIMAWTHFSSTVSQIASVFIQQANIISKVYFPRLILPLAASANAAINFAFQFLLFLAVVLYYVVTGAFEFREPLRILLLPAFLLHLVVLGLAFGLIVSSYTTKYRDLNFVLNFLLQLGMYGAPVVYSLESIPERWQWLLIANPMTMIVQGFRYSLQLTDYLNWTWWLLSLGLTVILSVFGLYRFRQVERVLTDSL